MSKFIHTTPLISSNLFREKEILELSKNTNYDNQSNDTFGFFYELLHLAPVLAKTKDRHGLMMSIIENIRDIILRYLNLQNCAYSAPKICIIVNDSLQCKHLLGHLECTFVKVTKFEFII